MLGIKDIPDISIFPEDSINVILDGEEHKYILIEVVPFHKEPQKKTVIAIANYESASHSGLNDRFLKKFILGNLLKAKTWSGGKFKSKNNALVIFDRSSSYGATNHEKAAEIARKHFKKNNMQIEIEIGPSHGLELLDFIESLEAN